MYVHIFIFLYTYVCIYMWATPCVQLVNLQRRTSLVIAKRKEPDIPAKGPLHFRKRALYIRQKPR